VKAASLKVFDKNKQKVGRKAEGKLATAGF